MIRAISLAAILLLTATPAMSATIVMCDRANAIVPGKVSHFLPSASLPPVVNDDMLVNKDLSALLKIDSRYWKCVGSQVLAMTVLERRAIDSSIPLGIRPACTEDRRGTAFFEINDGRDDEWFICAQAGGHLQWRPIRLGI